MRHSPYAAAGYDLTIHLTASATGAPLVLGRDFNLVARPNPFRGVTRLELATPLDEPVAVSIFDVQGRLLRRWSDVDTVGGYSSLEWDGRTAQGESAPAGVYFVRLDDGRSSRQEKLVRLR